MRSRQAFFAANGVNLPVIQNILRHSNASTTAIYTHRVNAAQRADQAKFPDAIKVTATADQSNDGLDFGREETLAPIAGALSF
jgi:hypothetical protein